jgi:hypothetical protein
VGWTKTGNLRPALGTGTPQPLGTAAAGTTTAGSPAAAIDHVHSDHIQHPTIGFTSAGGTALRVVGWTFGVAPTGGPYSTLDMVFDYKVGGYWECIAGGSPGTWAYCGMVIGTAAALALGAASAGTTALGTGSAAVDHVHPINNIGLGIVGWNSTTASPAAVTTTEVIALTATATLFAGRAYEIFTSSIMGQGNVAGDYMNMFIRQSAAGAAVSLTSTIIEQTILALPVANQIKDSKAMQIILDGPAAGTYQFGFTYSRASGTGSVQPQVAASRPLQLWIKDIGPAFAATP